MLDGSLDVLVAAECAVVAAAEQVAQRGHRVVHGGAVDVHYVRRGFSLIVELRLTLQILNLITCRLKVFRKVLCQVLLDF